MGSNYVRIQSYAVDCNAAHQHVDDLDTDVALSNVGRLGDHHLMLHILQNDSTMQNSLDYYRNNYADCGISCLKTPHKDDAADDRDMQGIVLQHLQTFLFEATTYHLVLGFVVFRFCKLPLHDDILVPLVVPIGDIVWSFGQSNHDGQELLQIPEIDVPMQSAGKDVRYYVYKFRSSGQYFSSECSGVLCRLTHSYRRLVHARDYDLIIRNETLRKTIFIEQAVKPDVSVLQKGTRASEYGELQAIMDYTRGHRATTHSATPPSQDEELKASITGQHQKETAAPDTEFIILPPNTQAKNVTASYGVVNVQAYKQEYEQEISAILFTPSIAEGGAQTMPQDATPGSAGCSQTSQASKTQSGGDGGKYSIQKLMLFCNKLRHMNTEFELLLSTIQAFCDSPDTARNIEKYNSERLLDSKHASSHKRQRTNPHRRHHEVIPIQLVTQCLKTNYAILADSTSGVLCCNTLTANSLMPAVSFVDYLKKTHGIPQSVKASIDCPAAVELRKAALESQKAPAAKPHKSAAARKKPTKRP